MEHLNVDDLDLISVSSNSPETPTSSDDEDDNEEKQEQEDDIGLHAIIDFNKPGASGIQNKFQTKMDASKKLDSLDIGLHAIVDFNKPGPSGIQNKFQSKIDASKKPDSLVAQKDFQTTIPEKINKPLAKVDKKNVPEGSTSKHDDTVKEKIINMKLSENVPQKRKMPKEPDNAGFKKSFIVEKVKQTEMDFKKADTASTVMETKSYQDKNIINVQDKNNVNMAKVPEETVKSLAKVYKKNVADSGISKSSDSQMENIVQTSNMKLRQQMPQKRNMSQETDNAGCKKPSIIEKLLQPEDKEKAQVHSQKTSKTVSEDVEIDPKVMDAKSDQNINNMARVPIKQLTKVDNKNVPGSGTSKREDSEMQDIVRISNMKLVQRMSQEHKMLEQIDNDGLKKSCINQKSTQPENKETTSCFKKPPVCSQPKTGFKGKNIDPKVVEAKSYPEKNIVHVQNKNIVKIQNKDIINVQDQQLVPSTLKASNENIEEKNDAETFKNTLSGSSYLKFDQEFNFLNPENVADSFGLAFGDWDANTDNNSSIAFEEQDEIDDNGSVISFTNNFEETNDVKKYCLCFFITFINKLSHCRKNLKSFHQTFFKGAALQTSLL